MLCPQQKKKGHRKGRGCEIRRSSWVVKLVRWRWLRLRYRRWTHDRSGSRPPSFWSLPPGSSGNGNLTKSVVSNHSWFVLKPSFDLISSQSGFYKATGIDISISPLIGGKVQCKGLRKFEDSEGNTRLRDLQCIPNITYGGAAEISWNFVKHAQLRVGVNYLTMPKEKDFIENIDAFVKDLNEADRNEVLSGNWQKGQFMVTASVTYHF